MGVKVKVPSQLRSLTEGQAEVDAVGDTVAAIIDDLEVRHPGIGTRLRDETGTLRRFVNVYVNGEDVRFLKGEVTPIEDGASISIIPSIAGG